MIPLASSIQFKRSNRDLYSHDLTTVYDMYDYIMLPSIVYTCNKPLGFEEKRLHLGYLLNRAIRSFSDHVIEM